MYGSRSPVPLVTLQDPRVHHLAAVALDAARAAGARYADTRLTITSIRNFHGGTEWDDTVRLGFSVRALVDGYWGWAATPYLAESEAPRLGAQAAALARGNATRAIRRVVDWPAIPISTTGSWTTPITTDPFELPLEEIADYGAGVSTYIFTLGNARGGTTPTNAYLRVGFSKQESLFASTEGARIHQQRHVIRPTLEIVYKHQQAGIDIGGPAQAGWEYLTEAPLRELILRKMDALDHASPLPSKPVAVGRFDLICPSDVVAALIGGTFGAATQIDRALGYEANASGTSYFAPDPVAQLGHSASSSLLTLTGERTSPRALATAGWDAEGVVPEPFPIIQAGVLVDYQTTREQAPWLAPWYTQRGLPVRSHGCANTPDALSLPMQHTPNLVMQPAPSATDEETLVYDLERGYLVESLHLLRMDFQQLNGYAVVDLVEIRNGKRVARIPKAGFLFRAPELWNGLQAIGGTASARWHVALSTKGEPEQGVEYSIHAVPARFAQQIIIDAMRKI